MFEGEKLLLSEKIKKITEGFLSDLADFSAFFEFKIFDREFRSQF